MYHIYHSSPVPIAQSCPEVAAIERVQTLKSKTTRKQGHVVVCFLAAYGVLGYLSSSSLLKVKVKFEEISESPKCQMVYGARSRVSISESRPQCRWRSSYIDWPSFQISKNLRPGVFGREAKRRGMQCRAAGVLDYNLPLSIFSLFHMPTCSMPSSSQCGSWPISTSPFSFLSSSVNPKCFSQ